jgi:triosephosphate isomerase (TIM)
VLQFGYMKKSTPLIIGNWKLNPGTETEAKLLAKGVVAATKKQLSAEIVVAPPFLFIPAVAKELAKKSVRLGAQDAHYEERGACTGEVSPVLLSGYGVTHVIIGHSERRALGETNVQVNKKVHTLLKRRLVPVVCVGERARDKNGNFYNVIEEQLRTCAEGLTAAQMQKVVIAYEPIWAIGTGATATPEDVKEMQLFIMSVLTKLYERKVAGKVTLLYGGSVKASNAKELYLQGGMQGFLVGGASLDAKEFAAIIEATI